MWFCLLNCLLLAVQEIKNKSSNYFPNFGGETGKNLKIVVVVLRVNFVVNFNLEILIRYL